MKLIPSGKKAVFVFCFVFIIILFGGFYFWAKNKEIGRVVFSGIRSSDIGNYEIKETALGKIIENVKDGLFFKVPENWIIKKVKTNSQSEVSLFDQNSEFDKNGDLLAEKSFKENGACGIGIAVIKCEKISSDISTDADMLSNYIKALQNNLDLGKDSGFSLNTVSNKNGLRQIINVEKDIRLISVKVPIGQDIFGFSTGLIFNEKCIEEFDNFLKTVSINK